MTKSLSNALKSVLVLVSIAVVCVGVLAVCNMFFPTYKPTLDLETAKLIDKICPTGVGYKRAYKEKYIVMLDDSEYGGDLAGFNKANKTNKAEVLAVYGEPKGEVDGDGKSNVGAFIVECKSEGNDSDVVILVAFKDGAVVGATCKKQNESYWNKLPKNLFDEISKEYPSGSFKSVFGSTGATNSLRAIERSCNLAVKFAGKYREKISDALQKIALGAGSDTGVSA
ncbi:MAG: hypothetical protein J1G38_07140 [Clostridiales bacterium]|nr:hypothetical protein [Clostridiales bacterium]